MYHAWALTTYFEAFVLLVAALAPFTSFAGLGRAARAARPLASISARLAEKEIRGRGSKPHEKRHLEDNFFRRAHAYC